MTDPAPQIGDPTQEQGPELAAALLQMSGLVLSRETVDTALQLVTRLAANTIPGSVGAGVTLVDERGKRSKAASDPVVERADALQYELDEGPCLAAQRTGRLVRIDDTIGDDRWPRWTEEVRTLGIRSVLSAPLVVAGESIGAIKVYSDQPDGYGAHEEQVMLLFAEQAAILLANTQSLQEARRLGRQLTEALTGRDLVNRAIGVLVGRGLATSGAAAFTMLTDAARHSDRTVHQVAQELLATASGDPTTV